MRSILQIGQSPGLGWRICGCIEHVHSWLLCPADAASAPSLLEGKPNHQPVKNRAMGTKIVIGFLTKKAIGLSMLVNFMIRFRVIGLTDSGSTLERCRGFAE